MRRLSANEALAWLALGMLGVGTFYALVVYPQQRDNQRAQAELDGLLLRLAQEPVVVRQVVVHRAPANVSPPATVGDAEVARAKTSRRGKLSRIRAARDVRLPRATPCVVRDDPLCDEL